jgi:hypothetical protein
MVVILPTNASVYCFIPWIEGLDLVRELQTGQHIPCNTLLTFMLQTVAECYILHMTDHWINKDINFNFILISVLSILYCFYYNQQMHNYISQQYLFISYKVSGVPKGVWGIQPPPTKFRSFDKAELNSQFRGKNIHNDPKRIRVSLICKLSGALD